MDTIPKPYIHQLTSLFLGVIRRPENVLELVQFLNTSLAVEVVGIIIYGSRAKGIESEASDLDVLVTIAEGKSTGIWDDSAAVPLDIYVEPQHTVLDSPRANWSHLAGGQLLFDKSGKLAPFLSELHELLSESPPSISPEERGRLQVWSRRMLRRIKLAHEQYDQPLAQFYAAQVITQLIPLYFQLRGMWFRSPKEAFAYLRQNEPQLSHAMQLLSLSMQDTDLVNQSLQRVVEICFSEQP
jgi:hypothetical protein